MSAKDKKNEAPIQQDMKLEDLPVNEATTEQVKGGPTGGDGRGYD